MMDVSWTYRGQCTSIFVHQTIMLYALHFNIDVWQLFLNKTRKRRLWLSLGSPQSRAWDEELGAESLHVRRSHETQMREREKGEPIKGISVRSWGSIPLGTLWEIVWDIPQNHLRNLQCLSTTPLLEGSQKALTLPRSQVIPLSRWATSLEQWFSDHQQQ